MNPAPLSVIVPNYNHGQYLPRCLEALLNQSLQPSEIIVIDDASTDNSVEVIEKFARNHTSIRVHRNGKNEGVIFGVNRGIDLARGEYLYFAPADDQTLPGLFEKSFALLRQYPQAALCCSISDFREIETGLKWHMGAGMASESCFLDQHRIVELEKRGKLYIAPNTSVIKRSALIEAGKFIPELKWHSDWFGFYVAGFRYGICFVPEPLAIFHVHASSYYSTGTRNKRVHREVLERMLALLHGANYRDVTELMRESGALYLFGKPMLETLLSRPEYRRFVTPTFLRKNLLRIVQLELKKITPTFIGNYYLRMTGKRMRTPET
jgi:glycosyltransferase involved in cell wall biosynthesis